MIEANGLSFSYGEKKVVKDVSFFIKKGVFAGICGPNGAGKTTLLHLISGIIKPDAGWVKIDGKEILKMKQNELAKKRGVLLQEYVFTFPYTVFEIVAMGRIPYQKSRLFLNDEDKKIIDYYLRMLELSDKKKRKFYSLSGGEKKRTLIAMALVQNPDILFLDEPLNSLDLYHQIKIMKFLKQLVTTRSLTVVSIFHDLNMISEFCDSVLLMNNGKLIKHGTPKEVFNFELLKKVFKVNIYIGINEITKNLFIHPFDEI